MKFTCTKENLIKGLQITSGIASKPSNLPILSHIHINATDSGVELVSTNLEIAIKSYIRAKVENPGTFAIPAKTFLDYISLLHEEQVHIELEGAQLIVSTSTSSTKIKGCSADDYPVIPEIEETHAYTIVAEELKKAFTQVVFSVAKNEIRPELSGVYCSFFGENNSGLILASTDSYRLTEKKVSVDQGGDDFTCIVPGKTIGEFIRILGVTLSKTGAESNVRLWASENQIAMRYGDFEITSRLIAGSYPDYTQIIPTDFESTAAVPGTVLINAIKAASIFTTTGVNAVMFDIDSGSSLLRVSSVSTQTGEHTTSVDAIVVGGTNAILLNHKYVLDGLQHIGADDIEFKMNGPDAPCVFKGKERDDYVYIVMPIRQ